MSTTAAAMAPPPRLGRRGRFVPNILSNGFNFAITILIGFWFTPYLIGKLGVAVYGLIPLAGSVTRYAGILTHALDQSVGRYLTISLRRNDPLEANRIFNAAFFGTLCLCAILVLPFTALAVFAERLLNVPAGYELETRVLIALTAAAFILDTLRAPFRAPCFALNRFDLQSAVEVLYQLSRVAVIVLLFALVSPSLSSVGAASVAAALLALLASLVACRHLAPGLSVAPRQVRPENIRQIGGTSVWVLASALGIILSFSVDLLVVNLLFGAEATGRYAVVWQWSTIIRTLAITLTGVFAPTIMSLHAGQNIEALVLYVRRSMKFVGLMLAVPAGVICGFSAPLLRIWLGEDFVSLAPLLALLVGHLAVNFANIPLSSVVLAANRVRVPAIANLVMGVLNLALALFLAGPAGWGLYGVAASGVIVLSLRNALFTPQYAAHTIGQRPRTFFHGVHFSLLGLGATAGAAFLISENFALESWFAIGAACVLVALVYFPLAWALFLKNDERDLARAMIASTCRRLVPATH